MNRFVLLVAVLAVGCESGPRRPGDSSAPYGPEEKDAQGVARQAFEKWNDANARGDVEASWEGMTKSLRQDWLWMRLKDNRDSIAQEHLQRMEPEERKTLDRWLTALEKAFPPPQRAQGLPESILLGRWVFDLYRSTFARARGEASGQAKARKVTEVYMGGDGGVTIITKLHGVPEIYSMEYEGNTWKVHLCMPAAHKKD